MQVAVSVDDERVRELLSRVSGTDLDVIFAPRKEPLTPPHYQLMTKDQLKEVSDCFTLCVSILVCVNAVLCRHMQKQCLKQRNCYR